MKLKNKLKETFVNLYWRFFSPRYKNPALHGAQKKFLFICTGNVCRGPFAERLAATLAKNYNLLKGAFFDSAGLSVSKSMPSPADAVRAAARFGVELASHRSRPITTNTIDIADMIIALDAYNFNKLRKLLPSYRDRIFLLPLYNSYRAGKASFLLYNIPDPYGKDFAEYLASFSQIEECLRTLFELLEGNR